MALSDDEHIVSSVRLGPCRLSAYDTRLAMLAALPVRLSGLDSIVAGVLTPVPQLLRHLDDAILPLAQVAPVRFHIHGLRIPPAQSDDRDRIRFGISARRAARTRARSRRGYGR